MLMPGKNKPERIAMWQYPFTLVKVCYYDEDENPVFAKPLWLIVVGKGRDELSLKDIYQAYRLRSNLEHFFRFGKQQLLLSANQTPETLREERWWIVTHIAYAMLWVGRYLVNHLPHPWERYLPTAKSQEMTPTLVRRDFQRLIQQLGTPTQPPKPRGKSPGRAKGLRLPPRPRQKVVLKSEKQPVAA